MCVVVYHFSSCYETVYRPNFQSVWKPYSTRWSSSCHVVRGQHRQYCFHVFCSTVRETAHLSNHDFWRFSEFTRHFMLRVHLFTERLRFIRSITSNIPLGKQRPQLYTDDLPVSLEFLQFLWLFSNALDVPQRAIPFQVSIRYNYICFVFIFSAFLFSEISLFIQSISVNFLPILRFY